MHKIYVAVLESVPKNHCVFVEYLVSKWDYFPMYPKDVEYVKCLVHTVNVTQCVEMSLSVYL